PPRCGESQARRWMFRRRSAAAQATRWRGEGGRGRAPSPLAPLPQLAEALPQLLPLLLGQCPPLAEVLHHPVTPLGIGVEVLLHPLPQVLALLGGEPLELLVLVAQPLLLARREALEGLEVLGDASLLLRRERAPALEVLADAGLLL